MTQNKIAKTAALRHIQDPISDWKFLDLFCWTPLAGFVRVYRRARIDSAARDLQLKRKTESLCRKMAHEYHEIITPSW
ncbi:MAG: hypothetical protein QF817_03670 [Candidatus Poseidoniaceae archaeon]|nr:hypothetical protein [Candidatus Poseidoniaceae archaeon]